MKTKQNFEGCGRQSEKVERHQVVCMIIKKAPPSRGRWRAMANPILGDGGLGNEDAQLRQLAMHVGNSPERVGSAHVPYQLTYFGATPGRPGLRRRLFHAQYRLNPQRCQRTTVSGFTMARTLSQSVQILRNSTQNSRSTFESRVRFTERRRTASCCRRATFSRASLRRALKAEMRAQTNAKSCRHGAGRPETNQVRCARMNK